MYVVISHIMQVSLSSKRWIDEQKDDLSFVVYFLCDIQKENSSNNKILPKLPDDKGGSPLIVLLLR